MNILYPSKHTDFHSVTSFVEHHVKNPPRIVWRTLLTSASPVVCRLCWIKVVQTYLTYSTAYIPRALWNQPWRPNRG